VIAEAVDRNVWCQAWLLGWADSVAAGEQGRQLLASDAARDVACGTVGTERAATLKNDIGIEA